MNQIEEFSNYYFHQINEEENPIILEDGKYQEAFVDKENTINDDEDIIVPKEITIKNPSSKKLNSMPKRYNIYTMDYKKQVLEAVKLHNNEKEVANYYGIKPKTLHRWIKKGFKKYQGKQIFSANFL